MTQRLMKEGKGWRIGWNRAAERYKALLGGSDWAIELTEAEFNDFCRLLEQLTQTMQQMTEELMEQERIACKAESDLVWLEVEGFPDAYSLRFILNHDRCCEGNWTKEAVQELVQAIQVFKGF